MLTHFYTLINKARALQLWDEGAYLHTLPSEAALSIALKRVQVLADTLVEVTNELERKEEEHVNV